LSFMREENDRTREAKFLLEEIERLREISRGAVTTFQAIEKRLATLEKEIADRGGQGPASGLRSAEG
jgi:hypothetical protein